MKCTLAATLAAILAIGGTAMAQPTSSRSKTASAKQTPAMTAEHSDPGTLGWMKGFPPPPGKRIHLADPDYFAFPKLRWTVCHFRELMPTVGVDRGSGGARELPVALDASLDAVTFQPLGSETAMTWRQAFDANYTDGILVLHHGRVVYERYGGCLGERALHGAMSVTKSLTGLLGEILIAEGRLKENALIGELVPELQKSAFGDATVRQVLDMTTALDFSEDYADPKAAIWAYSRAGSPLPPSKAAKGPRGYFEFLRTVKKRGTHGDAFGYKTVNSDALGWVISRATGKSVAELLSERIWSRIGADREAFYTVDSVGTPFAGGGFNSTLRDLARLGQLMLNDGRIGDEQIVPPAAIASIRKGGNREAFKAAGYRLLQGWSYRGMWWVSHDDHGAFAARGVHGQTIWVDPKADLVIVRFASNPVAANAASDPTTLPAFRAIAKHLMATDRSPLLGEEWVIESIAEAGIIDNSHATLHFLPNGRLAGSATCNRIIGSYTAEGAQLRIKPAGTTMMACPEALMNQERKVLDLLPRIVRFEIDATGELVLFAADGPAIRARR